MTTYKAVYYTSDNRSYHATIFLSSITLTIRFIGEDGLQKDIYWLADNIISLIEQPHQSELLHKKIDGATERLVIRDAELLKAIKKNFRYYKFSGSPHRFLAKTSNKILLVFVFFIGILALGYLWFVPWLGGKISNGFSKQWEVEMGDKMYESVAALYTIDSAKTLLLNDFYQQLHFNVDYPVEVTVVKGEEINAFAIPGGHIVIYDSILKSMQTPEELAALLSHEASHIALRHSLKNMFRSLARQMFLLMVFGNESGVGSFLVDNADNLKELEYSRSLETEADNNGLQLMAKSGINPKGMLLLMEVLQKHTGANEPAAFLNTHPVFKNRIENIKKQIQQLPSLPKENNNLKSIFDQLQSIAQRY